MENTEFTRKEVFKGTTTKYVLHRVLITKRNMENNFKIKNAEKKCIYFSSLFYSYMAFGSVAISFRCAFLRNIELFPADKYIKLCRSDTCKTIHDDGAFRYIM